MEEFVINPCPIQFPPYRMAQASPLLKTTMKGAFKASPVSAEALQIRSVEPRLG